jgi:hypothetical protein
MKPGRNDSCSCGSGKKYKRCCMDSSSKQHAEMCDDIAQTAAMNPDLSLEELNLVAQHKITEQNNRPRADFCGLSSSQLSNWLYAPFSELTNVTFNIPNNLSTSPVMRYLALILDEAMQHDGAFKATSKGNLPAKLVKQASDVLPEFAVAQYQTVPSISEYTGTNEDKFNALHYTRILAEVAGIIVQKNGHFQVKKTAQKQYQAHGLQAFFLPMLEAAITKYNWGYFDSWTQNSDLRTFWLFMLWRLHSHGGIDKLIEEVCVAFPDLLRQFSSTNYYTPQDQLGSLILLPLIQNALLAKNAYREKPTYSRC